MVHRNVVIQKHSSVAPRATLDAAINDAARQAYGVFCHDHSFPFNISARRYLPRCRRGEVAHEIAPLVHGANAQLATLLDFTAALLTEHEALLDEHRQLYEKLEQDLPNAPRVEPAQTPPRKKLHYGEPSSHTRVLPSDD